MERIVVDLQHWWNTTGYLQSPCSVVVNVSFFQFSERRDSWNMEAPIRAAMLTAVADYRHANRQDSCRQMTGRGDNKTALL
jgi:hypothetical protein